MKPYVIGVDLGTGSAKAIAIDGDGAIIDTAQMAYPTLQPKSEFQEQDPELIWHAFTKCIRAITSRMGDEPVAIALSSAMHSVIPVGQKGEALMNMMIWADNRSAGIARRIHGLAIGKSIYEECGTPIHAMTPLCKIVWLREHAQDIYSRTAKFISIKEYIWFRLFSKFEVDYSIASATGMMNISGLAWHNDSLITAGIRKDQLSDLVNTNHQRQCTSNALTTLMGISERTVFVIGASDGCLANVGSFATEEGEMALTIGTSGAVRITRKRPMLNFKAMTFNYRLDESTYVCGGPINNGGVALKWYAEKLLGKKLVTAKDYTVLLEALKKTMPGADGLIFLPYILGERAPIWNSDACGIFFGVRAHHEEMHFTRAVVEGISTSLYDITYNMIEAGLDIGQINVSGGFVHSEDWLQLLADMFGRKVCLINTADASAIGAAYLSMKHLGMISDYQQLMPREIRSFAPQPENMASYRKLFLRYRTLYEAVSPLMSGDET